jgi:hypothetical protein
MFVRIKTKSKLSENEEATIFNSRIISNTLSVKLWKIYKAEQSRRSPGNGMLEVSSPSKGILITDVALTGSTDPTTIASPAVSLLVYKTAKASDSIPGYFYNSGTIVSPIWTRLAKDTTISQITSLQTSIYRQCYAIRLKQF